MDLMQQTVTDFLNITASNAPAPGGGSVSALAGALAAALSQMVANLTVGRKKYAEVQDELEGYLPRLAQAQTELMAAVDEDSRAFDLYMAALSMPKETQEEKAARKTAMQEGLKAAVRVPLSVATRVVEIMPMLEQVLMKGNSNAVTDGMVSVMMARTGVLGAIYNVRVNLSSIEDEAYVADMTARCAQLQSQALEFERRVLGNCPLACM